jgi:hypothetical protein
LVAVRHLGPDDGFIHRRYKTDSKRDLAQTAPILDFPERHGPRQQHNGFARIFCEAITPPIPTTLRN